MNRRLSSVLASLMLGALLLVATACATANRPASNEPATYVSVDNRNFLDMTIYVWRGAERVRLGTAKGSSTTRLRIPSSLVHGVTSLRFQADPVGGARTPVSMEVLISPGEEVGIQIPST